MKYIRGDIFSEKQWYELFQILGMPMIQLSDLKAKHFLDARNEIVANYREVKVSVFYYYCGTYPWNPLLLYGILMYCT